MSARVEAAKAVLELHDALTEVAARAPEKGATGLPVDALRWAAWYDNECRPAYDEWHAAMTHLAEVFGEEFPGRDPFWFRPFCERIVETEG